MLPLDDLLVKHLQPASGQRVLALTQGQPVRALASAYPHASVDAIDMDFPSRQQMERLAAQEPRRNLALAGGLEAGAFPDSPPPGRLYRIAVILIPKGRQLAQRWLIVSAAALAAEGRLVLAGPKDLGIQSIAHDAEALLGGKGVVLGYKKGQRMIAFTRPEVLPEAPAWAAQPGIAPGTWALIHVDTPAGQFALKTLPGVFAYDGLDDGSRLLIENLSVTADDKVLDLGCGAGVIGVFAARCGARWVEMVDSNLLAVAATRRNLADLGLENAIAYAGDALSETTSTDFSLIVSNPPFHSGKAVDYHAAEAFIRQGSRALRPGGRMVIVANRFIRYDRLMGELFARVETLAVTGRFHVLCGWL